MKTPTVDTIIVVVVFAIGVALLRLVFWWAAGV